MSLENIKIWVSPMTNIIYAGYLNKDGTSARQKIDVSDQVKSAMMEYMYKSKGEYLTCPVGELRFIPKNADSGEEQGK